MIASINGSAALLWGGFGTLAPPGFFAEESVPGFPQVASESKV
jgi:hypothetical protein